MDNVFCSGFLLKLGHARGYIHTDKRRFAPLGLSSLVYRADETVAFVGLDYSTSTS